jgi:transposase
MEDKNLLDLYYFDSCIFSLVPYIPYAWQKKGYEIEIESSHSKNINVLGFLKRDNTFTPYTIEGSVNSEVIVHVFENFINTLNPERKSKIIIDNAPTHTSKLFESMKPIWKKKNVHIFNLPPYSPELNKIEILWRFIKYMWISFEAYTSYENLQNSLDHILKNVGKEFTISFA